ncbi:leucine-rich repeat domain-containing protein [Propionicimonas paludicola]|uniref:leucine-rich repeat domain-containing protein n=1 Tax=Propionicimonas paludicola TaxID=185243 RepID=UPI001472B75B|nr:leucine-rich repeat domain-containing protein [Propionicimonas paludicola]
MSGSLTIDLAKLDEAQGPLSELTIQGGDEDGIDCLSNLTSISFINARTHVSSMIIEEYAFRQAGTNTLTSITFPEGLASLSIGTDAFAQVSVSGDNRLSTVKFPSTVISLHIGAYAFAQTSGGSGSTALTEVTFPAGLRDLQLGDWAFAQDAAGATTLSSITFPDAPDTFTLGVGVFNQSGRSGTSLTEVSFPRGLTSLTVPSQAFGQRSEKGALTLSSITFPNGLIALDIGSGAFSQSSGMAGASNPEVRPALTSVQFPNSITELTIGENAFLQVAHNAATALASVTFPDQMISLTVEAYAFYQWSDLGAALSDLTFPTKVSGRMKIGDSAFRVQLYESGAIPLASVVFPREVGNLEIDQVAFMQSTEGAQPVGLSGVVLPQTVTSLSIGYFAFNAQAQTTHGLSLYFPFSTPPARTWIPFPIDNGEHVTWYWFGEDGADIADWTTMQDNRVGRVAPQDDAGPLPHRLVGYRSVNIKNVAKPYTVYVYPDGANRLEPYQDQADTYGDNGTWTLNLPPKAGDGFLGWCTTEVTGTASCEGDLHATSGSMSLDNVTTTLWGTWAAVPAPTFEELVLTEATLGQPYDLAISLSGQGPITCALDPESVLPPGLTLTEQCHLIGTPTAAGQYTFSVAATNQGGTTTEELSLQVGSNSTPTPTPTTPPDELAHTGSEGTVPLTGLALVLTVTGLGLILGRHQLRKQ